MYEKNILFAVFLGQCFRGIWCLRVDQNHKTEKVAILALRSLRRYTEGGVYEVYGGLRREAFTEVRYTEPERGVVEYAKALAPDSV